MSARVIVAGLAWRGFADIVRDLAPRNRALLTRRDERQARIASTSPTGCTTA